MANFNWLVSAMLWHGVLTSRISVGAFETRPSGASFKEYTLNITQSFVSPDGVYKSGFHINGHSPGPCIEGDEGDWIRVIVHNMSPVTMSIHFHGILQRGTPWSDGVSGITQPPIHPGHFFTYEFQVKNQYGFTWYHAHHRGYLTDGVYGPMNFVASAHRARPYHMITNNTNDLDMIRELERSPISLIGDDSFKWNMDVIMARMYDFGIDPLCIQSILINGKGRVNCLNETTIQRLQRKHLAPQLIRESIFDKWGCMRMENGYANATDIDALEMPGHYKYCNPTTSPQYVLKANASWHYFNVLNAGGQFTKTFSIDGHILWLVAIDGVFVEPKPAHQLMMPVGSRFSIVVKARSGKFKIRFAAALSPQFVEGVGYLINREDSVTEDAEIYQDLDGKLMNTALTTVWPRDTIPYEVSAKYNLHNVAADHTFQLYLNRTGMVTFSMFDGGLLLPMTFEHEGPLIDTLNNEFGEWALRDNIALGDVIDIIINNSNSMGHPVHLHGHLFYLASHSDSENFKYVSLADAVADGYDGLQKNPPLFDVTYIPADGHSVIRFVADNPGIWMIHCHNLGHLIGGMGAVVVEAEDELSNMLMNKRQLSRLF